jgi:phospholipid/cholesterol/gamma-HCH transport system substrate-binding protein
MADDTDKQLLELKSQIEIKDKELAELKSQLSVKSNELVQVKSDLEAKTKADVEVKSQLAEIVTKLNSGRGTLGRLIHDTLISYNLRMTMENLNSGTRGVDEIIVAAKHNILFRGYFKRKQKAAEKIETDSVEARIEKQKETDLNKELLP